MNAKQRFSWLTSLALVLGAQIALSQPPPAAPTPPPSPRAGAPIDLAGQWVAIVNEDWRWRMVTPPKGDVASVPLNDEGRRVANEWDPASDGSCLAYGAAGLLRQPTRLRIRWDGEDRLVLETDAGRQTRTLSFAPSAASAPRSLQGQSTAKWVTPARQAGGPGLVGSVNRAGGSGGYLDVRTTNLSGGWLRRNGVPYSEDAVMTEYFTTFKAPNDSEWLMVTTIVEDPRYLTQRYIVSNHFRREPQGGRWNPQACKGAS
jgi:YD repeat-containing protein